jgi:hypothetical protein
MHTYKHSGIVPIGGAILVAITGIITAFVGGTAYAYLIVWCPWIYLCILGTLAFGGLMGGVVASMCKAGKIRNAPVRLGLTLLFATIGIYTEWAVTPSALQIQGIGFVDGFNPLVMIQVIEVLYQVGAWGLVAGNNVTGIFLVLFWIAEICTIYVTAIMASNRVANDLPFCETCDQWTTWTRGLHAVNATGDEPIWEKVKYGEILPALELKAFDLTSDKYVRFDTATCSKCGQTAFLTISRVKLTVDKNGGVNEATHSIARHLVIDDFHVIAILEAAKIAQAELQARLMAESGDGVNEQSSDEAPQAAKENA